MSKSISEIPSLTPIVDLSTDVRTSKHYRKEHFEEHYTEEYEKEYLQDMLKDAQGAHMDISEKLHEVKDLTKRHKWTWFEDEFIKSNYHYLSDNVIGLALNVPGRFVKLRRLRLGLKKGAPKDACIPYKVIVWCDREAYEEDLKRFNLNGTLPSKSRGTSYV